jgi:hypothetical protein
MKKSKKSNYLIVALVVLLLALAVGYAAFSQTLTITGTATAKGSWNVHFDNFVAPSDDTTSKLNTANTELTISTALTQPGDSKEYTVDVVNEGSMTAELTGFTIASTDSTATVSETGGTITLGAIKVTISPVSATGTTLAAETGSQTYTITVEWPSSYDTTASVNDELNFSVTLEYAQA